MKYTNLLHLKSKWASRFWLLGGKLSFIALLLLFFLVPAFSQEVKKRIAVMPFEYGGGVTKEEALFLTDRVRIALIKTGSFDVISNDQLEAMVKIKEKKQGIGSGSCNTEQCIIDLGNALECEKMMVGSAAGAFGEFVISGKILDVVTQQYELAENITIKEKSEFSEASTELISLLIDQYADEEENKSVVSVTYTDMLWRTALIPGWGHIYASQTRGWIYLGFFTLSSAIFGYYAYDTSVKKTDYLKAADQLQTRYDTYNNASKMRAYSSWVLIAIYSASLTDILISGKKYSLPHKNSRGTFAFQLDIFNLKENQEFLFKISKRY